MKARLELERYQNPGLKWGLVVSALAIFYENMSSNLAKVDSFLAKFENDENERKEAMVGTFKKSGLNFSQLIGYQKASLCKSKRIIKQNKSADTSYCLMLHTMCCKMRLKGRAFWAVAVAQL